MFAFYCNSAPSDRGDKSCCCCRARTRNGGRRRSTTTSQRQLQLLPLPLSLSLPQAVLLLLLLLFTASASASAHAHQQSRRQWFYQLRSASRIYRKTVEIVSSLPAHRVRFSLFSKTERRAQGRLSSNTHTHRHTMAKIIISALLCLAMFGSLG